MAGTGYYYMMTRSRLKTRPLEFMKYDPIGKCTSNQDNNPV